MTLFSHQTYPKPQASLVLGVDRVTHVVPVPFTSPRASGGGGSPTYIGVDCSELHSNKWHGGEN